MPASTSDILTGLVPAQPELARAVVGSVESALAMCGITARCAGIASVPMRDGGLVTGMIGVHGKVSGFIMTNLSERAALRAAEGLLGEQYERITAQVIDATGELTNIIVGGIKGSLSGTQWAFSHITVPSVIVGRGYQVTYARGLEFVCATFEHDDREAICLEDRLMQVSISLLRL